MIALYRFWPDVARGRARGTVEGAAGCNVPGDGGASRSPMLTTTLGAYDLAVDLGEGGERRGGGVAGAGGGGGGGRGAGVARPGTGWAAGLEETGIAIPEPEIEAFDDIAAEVPFLLLRAMGGWNLVASPDRETWLTLSMTFLNRRAYQRFNTEGAWFSPRRERAGLAGDGHAQHARCRRAHA